MAVDMLGIPAQRRWSTRDVDSRHALAYWVETVSRTFLEIDIDSPEREHFHAQLDQSELGPASLCVLPGARPGRGGARHFKAILSLSVRARAHHLQK